MQEKSTKNGSVASPFNVENMSVMRAPPRSTFAISLRPVDFYILLLRLESLRLLLRTLVDHLPWPTSHEALGIVATWCFIPYHYVRSRWLSRMPSVYLLLRRIARVNYRDYCTARFEQTTTGPPLMTTSSGWPHYVSGLYDFDPH